MGEEVHQGEAACMNQHGELKREMAELWATVCAQRILLETAFAAIAPTTADIDLLAKSLSNDLACIRLGGDPTQENEAAHALGREIEMMLSSIRKRAQANEGKP